jgi:hypothetical protein
MLSLHASSGVGASSVRGGNFWRLTTGFSLATGGNEMSRAIVGWLG